MYILCIYNTIYVYVCVYIYVCVCMCIHYICVYLGFPGGSVDKESACNVGHLGLISGLGRSTGKGNGYPLQYSGLKNSMDRGAWHIVHGVAKSRTGLNNFHFHV